MRKDYVIELGHTAFGEFLDRSVKSLPAETVNAALSDAQIQMSELNAVFFGNAMRGVVTRQEMVRGQVALRPIGIDRAGKGNSIESSRSLSPQRHL